MAGDGLSEEKMGAVRALLAVAPDSLLSHIGVALIGWGGPAASQVRKAADEERADRELRAVVFQPVLPLFHARSDGLSSVILPTGLLGKAWGQLRRHDPDLIEECREAAEAWCTGDPTPPVYDRACATAAWRLRDAFQTAPDADRELAEEFAAYLDLAPVVRRAVKRLSEWLGRPTEAGQAGFKLLVKDAVEARADAAPRLFELIFGQLDQGWQILNLAAGAVGKERPADRFLAESELAVIGERLLVDAEARVERIRTMEAKGGAAAAKGVGADIARVCQVLDAFDKYVELSRDGPWGKRVFAARKNLAEAVESRLKQVEDALLDALPVVPVRHGMKVLRYAPRLDRDPDLAASAKARALFALLDEARLGASVAGYGALHAQVLTDVEKLIDTYVEDLVEEIPELTGAPLARAELFLDIAAELLEKARGPKPAEIVRRRAAAALSAALSKDVA